MEETLLDCLLFITARHRGWDSVHLTALRLEYIANRKHAHSMNVMYLYVTKLLFTTVSRFSWILL